VQHLLRMGLFNLGVAFKEGQSMSSTERCGADGSGELSQAQSLAELVLQLTPNPYLVKSDQGTLIYVNEAFSNFMGKESGDLVGRNLLDVFPSEAALRHLELDRQVMEEREEQIEQEWVQGAQSRRCYQMIKTPLGNLEGEVLGVLCSWTDVTDLKKERQRVKQLKEQIPICASCKKIRIDGDFWEAAELYLQKQTGRNWTHGLCPDCVTKFFPEDGAGD
jgi:PAS domain S-box-containing protein